MKIEEKNILLIKNMFETIENSKDFVNLLNYTKVLIYGEDSKIITSNQLNYYAHPTKCIARYSTFSIRKKSGGERQINSPALELSSILSIFNVVLQCCIEPHKAANGFVLNKSIVTNATLHIGKNYVYNIDLKDFFHSFDRNRLKMAFIQEPFYLKGNKEPIAFLIASLCTHPLLFEDGSTKTVLPQGSPTSPTLTNLLCVSLDRRLNGLAKKFGARYSRYADDITFSCDQNVFKKEDFQKELKRIIEEDQSLKINEKKTRLQKIGYRKEVTGLTVNEKVNVQKRYVKQIRMWIYYLEKYGNSRAQELFVADYKKDKGYFSNRIPNLEKVIKGKLDFLKMVKGENDPTYHKLIHRFNLLNKVDVKNNSNSIKLEKVLNLLLKNGLNSSMLEYRKLKTNERK